MFVKDISPETPGNDSIHVAHGKIISLVEFAQIGRVCTNWSSLHKLVEFAQNMEDEEARVIRSYGVPSQASGTYPEAPSIHVRHWVCTLFAYLTNQAATYGGPGPAD